MDRAEVRRNRPQAERIGKREKACGPREEREAGWARSVGWGGDSFSFYFPIFQMFFLYNFEIHLNSNQKPIITIKMMQQHVCSNKYIIPDVFYLNKNYSFTKLNAHKNEKLNQFRNFKIHANFRVLHWCIRPVL